MSASPGCRGGINIVAPLSTSINALAAPFWTARKVPLQQTRRMLPQLINNFLLGMQSAITHTHIVITRCCVARRIGVAFQALVRMIFRTPAGCKAPAPCNVVFLSDLECRITVSLILVKRAFLLCSENLHTHLLPPTTFTP